MAYNRRNLLQRAIKVQNITLEHTQKGISQEWVFNNVIKPRLDISRKTYYNYLSLPAKMELKRLESVRQQQLQMF